MTTKDNVFKAIIFRSKIDKIFVTASLLVISFLGLLIFQTIVLDSGTSEDFVELIFLFCLSTTIFVCVQFGSYCKIENRNLIVYVCFVPRRVSISTIRSMEMNASYFVGIRTSFRKGLIINYNKFDDFYITPKDETKLVEMIEYLNEFVIVKGRKDK